MEWSVRSIVFLQDECSGFRLVANVKVIQKNGQKDAGTYLKPSLSFAT
jgi:hypothetical protein